jgi:hypothetical protein
MAYSMLPCYFLFCHYWSFNTYLYLIFSIYVSYFGMLLILWIVFCSLGDISTNRYILTLSVTQPKSIHMDQKP